MVCYKSAFSFNFQTKNGSCSPRIQKTTDPYRWRRRHKNNDKDDDVTTTTITTNTTTSVTTTVTTTTINYYYIHLMAFFAENLGKPASER